MAAPAPTVTDLKIYLDTELQSSPYVFKKGQAVKITYNVADTDGVQNTNTNRILFKNADGSGYVSTAKFSLESGDVYDGVWALEFTFPSDGNYIDLHTPINNRVDGLNLTYQFYDVDSTRAMATTTVTYDDEAGPTFAPMPCFLSQT